MSPLPQMISNKIIFAKLLCLTFIIILINIIFFGSATNLNYLLKIQQDTFVYLLKVCNINHYTL
jgi:hypothetical protein